MDIEHTRELARLRAKRHYDLKKIDILKKKQDLYALKNGITPKIPVPVFDQADFERKIIESGSKQGTAEKYINAMKLLLQLIGTDMPLNNPEEVIAKINTSLKRDGKPYSNSTKEGLLQLILVYLKLYGGIDVDQKYNDAWLTYKIREPKPEKPVENFTTYLQKIKTQYGVDSKEFLLASYYNELTLRDDFGLKIVDTDSEGNYLLVSPEKIEIVINTYKTDRYGTIRHKMTKPLEKLTRAYMTKNNLKIGDLLFGADKLSSFIVKMNRDAGFDGGINYLRHSKISTVFPDMTPEQKVALSKVMKHSPVVQKKYVRKMM